jgi:hypothetical protein
VTRTQRIFLALAIPFFAWLLHVKTCDWHYRASVSFYSNTPGAGPAQQTRWWIWGRLDKDPATGGMVTTGVTTNQWVHLDTALVWGLFIPLGLVAADIWWLLGWRRSHRLATGCCAACGYDLKGSPGAAQCPECGAAAATRAWCEQFGSK